MTRQEDDCFRVIYKRSPDLCATRPRAPVCRLRCVALAAGSVKKSAVYQKIPRIR
jgi:hypothetical protein